MYLMQHLDDYSGWRSPDVPGVDKDALFLGELEPLFFVDEA